MAQTKTDAFFLDEAAHVLGVNNLDLSGGHFTAGLCLDRDAIVCSVKLVHPTGHFLVPVRPPVFCAAGSVFRFVMADTPDGLSTTEIRFEMQPKVQTWRDRPRLFP